MSCNSLLNVVFVTTMSLCVLCSARAEPPAWGEGLSDRELAIQRWFSHLTFLQDRSAEHWAEWHDDGKQLGITSLRYQMAFGGYGCAVMAAKTPAYREIVGQQLLDLCERMIDLRAWYYVTHYWEYGEGPPDPCRYENVMYTGHLTQLMGLYELLTGDMRYSERGWDFVWRDGRKVHYDLKQAVERLHDQCKAHPSGGICCEPNLLFADCNSHSALSFLLCDVVHGTDYAKVNPKWFDWMSKNFQIRDPENREFLFVLYNRKVGLFMPVADVGADCWALGWGYPWFPKTAFAEEGWRHTLDRAQWQHPQANQAYAQNSVIMGCCGGVPLALSNAFIPLLGRQVDGTDSLMANKVLNWLEDTCGRAVDTDGDGHDESYYYHTCDAHRISATGLVSAALATNGDSLRHLFRTSRRDIQAAPTLAHVDYPRVFVQSAEYIAPVLRFVVRKGVPRFDGATEIVCTQIPKMAGLTRDGRPYDDFHCSGTTVTIRTDADRPHVFELNVAP